MRRAEARAVGPVPRGVDRGLLVAAEPLAALAPRVGVAREGHGPAEHAGHRPAEGPSRRRAPGAHRALEGEAEGDQCGARGDRAELLVGTPERVQGASFGGDVAHVGHGRDGATVAALEHGGLAGDVTGRAAADRDPQLELDGAAPAGGGGGEALGGGVEEVRGDDVEQVHLAGLAGAALDQPGERGVRAEHAAGEVEQHDADRCRGEGDRAPVGRGRFRSRLVPAVDGDRVGAVRARLWDAAVGVRHGAPVKWIVGLRRWRLAPTGDRGRGRRPRRTDLNDG